MPEQQSFKVSVVNQVRDHLDGKIDANGVCAISKRLDGFLSTMPCGAEQVTPAEAAEQIICGVS